MIVFSSRVQRIKFLHFIRIILLVTLLFLPVIFLVFGKATRDSFINNQNGLKYIQSFAFENYDSHVVLGSTFLETSMESHLFYCELNWGIFNSIDWLNGENHVAWLKGKMVHELAHCLDVNRDMPSLTNKNIGSKSIFFNGILPIKNLEQYFEIEATPETLKYREAFADIFTVGYWRITESNASDLVTKLLKKRINDDQQHRTNCWIIQANDSNLPTNYKQLVNWSDNIRANSNCGL